jgi:hypothetical protein
MTIVSKDLVQFNFGSDRPSATNTLTSPVSAKNCRSERHSDGADWQFERLLDFMTEILQVRILGK